MADRRWITREEIAEIWDSIARRHVRVHITTSNPGDILPSLSMAVVYQEKAGNIRATAKLDNPLGSRT